MRLPWGVGAQERAVSYKDIVSTCYFSLCMKCMQQVDIHHGHAQAVSRLHATNVMSGRLFSSQQVSHSAFWVSNGASGVYNGAFWLSNGAMNLATSGPLVSCMNTPPHVAAVLAQ